MQQEINLTAIIHKDPTTDWYVSLCPEVDVASQGKTIEEARACLIEAVRLLFETASPAELAQRVPGDIYIAPFRASFDPTAVTATHA